MVPVGDEKLAMNRKPTVLSQNVQQRLPHPGSTPLWGPCGIQHAQTDVCGFVKYPNSPNEWLIRKHGAFEIGRKELGLSSKD